jgi:hypothetical protein
MSEYQYYEFRAVDRPLTSREIASLRAISSRAIITPTSFVNTYNYGDFGGDPDALMEKYFDEFVYVANWGTHQFMLRAPSNVLGRRDCAPYCKGDSLRVWSAQDHVVLSFHLEGLESDYDEEGEGWMDSLAPLRADLLRGDLRALYLGWLLAVGREEIEDDEPEPRVPPGLRDLSEPLQSLADFLYIDPDLLESAATASADLKIESPPPDLLEQWVAGLPKHEKNALLVQVAMGSNPHLGADLIRRFQLTLPKAPANTAQARRTAGELRSAAEALAEEKMRREEEGERREREVEEERKAAERTKRLRELAAREESAWAEVDRLIATKRPNDYDRAVLLLLDLRDVAAGTGRGDLFKRRFRGIAERHAAKPSFLRKLRDAGLQA